MMVKYTLACTELYMHIVIHKMPVCAVVLVVNSLKVCYTHIQIFLYAILYVIYHEFAIII